MSLYQWLKPVLNGNDATSSANKEVLKELNRSESEGKVAKRKRGMYNHYDDEVKAKVAKYENGNKAAVVKFSEKLGHLNCQGKLSFLTETLQNHAQKYNLAIDELSFKFSAIRKYRKQEDFYNAAMKGEEKQIDENLDVPTDGVLVHGLFMML